MGYSLKEPESLLVLGIHQGVVFCMYSVTIIQFEQILYQPRTKSHRDQSLLYPW